MAPVVDYANPKVLLCIFEFDELDKLDKLYLERFYEGDRIRVDVPGVVFVDERLTI